jgi:SulP family sulfate permease
VLDRIAETPRGFAVDFTDVPFIDSSGARSFDLLARKMARKGGRLFFTAANPDVVATLRSHGLQEPRVSFLPDIAAAEAQLAADSENESLGSV